MRGDVHGGVAVILAVAAAFLLGAEVTPLQASEIHVAASRGAIFVGLNDASSTPIAETATTPAKARELIRLLQRAIDYAEGGK